MCKALLVTAPCCPREKPAASVSQGSRPGPSGHWRLGTVRPVFLVRALLRTRNAATAIGLGFLTCKADVVVAPTLLRGGCERTGGEAQKTGESALGDRGVGLCEGPQMTEVPVLSRRGRVPLHEVHGGPGRHREGLILVPTAQSSPGEQYRGAGQTQNHSVRPTSPCRVSPPCPGARRFGNGLYWGQSIPLL